MASPFTCLCALSWATALLTPPFTVAAASRTGTRSSTSPPPLADDAGLGAGLGGFDEELQQQVLGDAAAIFLARAHVGNRREVLAQRTLSFGDGGARPRLALERGLAGRGTLWRWRHAAEGNADIVDDAVGELDVEGAQRGRDVLVEALRDLVAVELPAGLRQRQTDQLDEFAGPAVLPAVGDEIILERHFAPTGRRAQHQRGAEGDQRRRAVADRRA